MLGAPLGGSSLHGSRGIWRAGLVADDLWCAELFEAFEPVAGLRGPPEGYPRVHGPMLVDPNCPGLDAGDDFAGLVLVRGPDGGAETDVQDVGELDGFVDGGVLDDWQAGPNVRDKSGGREVARPGRAGPRQGFRRSARGPRCPLLGTEGRRPGPGSQENRHQSSRSGMMSSVATLRSMPST